MNRKRDKPYHHQSRHVPYSLPKRRRPLPPPLVADESSSAPTATAVLVIGLPTDCSVLDLKSRFEVYGPISRTRIDPNGVVGSVTFRSKSGADAAVSAALDPTFGITFDSKRVQVILSSDDANRKGEGKIGLVGADGDHPVRHSSKLLRAETPLSRHGRLHNRLSSAVVRGSPPSSPTGGSSTVVGSSISRRSNSSGGDDAAFKGREIVAYDDIL